MISLQLYTVREESKADLLGTLRTVAGQGYRAVEFAGLQGVPVEEVRSTLDELGMTTSGIHTSLERLRDDLDGIIAECHTLATKYAILAYLQERDRDVALIPTYTSQFNEWGQRLANAGLSLVYHNHDFEFLVKDGNGTMMLDRFLAETDPALVRFELDVFWAVYAGIEPIGLINSLAGRMPIIHVKDMGPSEDRPDCPVGEGTIDWPPLLKAARAAGAEWFVVEQDHPVNPIQDVGTSLNNLTQLMADLP